MTSFNENALVSKEENATGSIAAANAYETYESRQLRYALLWAQFQNNAYRNINTWSATMKTTYDLYPHIRDIYNPSFRVATFYQHHLWSGPLDPEAGNGEDITTCFPILDASSEVTKALKRLWRDSNLQRSKNIIGLQGAVFGDTYIKINDDPDNEYVYMQRVDPRWVSRKETDSLGNVTAYTIQYPILKEYSDNEYIMYKEEADLLLEGGVSYKTFANDQPYAWDGISDEWIAPYPFVPLVHIPHNDVGSEYGWAEVFPKLQTFRELDDITSKISDQIRKMVDSVWMFSGVKKPRNSTASVEDSSIGREDLPIIYAPDPNAKPHPLVSPLDLGAALQHVDSLMSDVESTFPELRVAAGSDRTSGDLSGRALLIARQEVEDKIRERRMTYDAQLVVAHKMAFILGGLGGYEDYKPFASATLMSGEKMHHRIGARGVFTLMEAERFEQEKQLWINGALAQRVGVSLDIFLRREGWSEEKITEIIESDEYKLRTEMMELDVTSAVVGGSSVGDKSLELPDSAMLDPNKPFSDFQAEG